MKTINLYRNGAIQVVMFFMLIALILLLAMVGWSLANESCFDPCPKPPACPEVNVTCNCDCGQVELPGLYEMSIKGHKRCGTITIIGSSFLFDGEWSGLGINKIKLATPVGSCE